MEQVNTIFDQKRKLQIIVQEVQNLNTHLVGGSIVIPQTCEMDLSSMNMLQLPKWAEEQLTVLVKTAPRVSGEDTIHLSNPLLSKECLTLLSSRYIDARLEQILEYQAQIRPDKEALVDLSTDRRYTYRELNDLSNKFACALYRLDVRKDEHIGVIMPNSAENFIVKFAASKLGARIININFYEKGDMMRQCLHTADVETLIMYPRAKDTEHIDSLYETCPELMNVREGKELSLKVLPKLKRIILARNDRHFSGTISMHELLEGTNAVPYCDIFAAGDDKNCEDIATIIHTSGSTGTPKGVMLTHKSIAEVLCRQVEMVDLTEDDRACLSLPLFHAFGSIGTSLPTFLVGGTVICLDRPSIKKLLKTIIEEYCTVFCNVPAVYTKLLQEIHCRKINPDRFHLNKCVAAGAVSPEQMLKEVARVFSVTNVIATYGMTETATGITGSRPEDTIEMRTCTVGSVWPGVEVKFIDPDTQEQLPEGTVGEICVRGFNVMKGYYNNPQETAKVLDKDGWLRTGDLGLKRSDGYICFTGRGKDIVKKCGEIISPMEIENVLHNCNGVEEAFVVGKTNTEFGETIVAFVSKAPDALLTEEDVLRFCAQHMPRFKLPSKVLFREEFPLSATGKILKNALREIANQTP